MMTTTAGHTAVRAANTAGKQVTVQVSYDASKYTAPAPVVGTARWTDPGNPNCRTLVLYGITVPAFADVYDANGTAVPAASGGGLAALDPRPHPRPWTVGPQAGDTRTDPRPATTVLRLDDIDTITTAAIAADTTLGTYVNNLGYRVPDTSWQNGTGLE